MMSSSPHCGHGVLGHPLPSIQKAGHNPCPVGSLIRASTLPGTALYLPRVVISSLVFGVGLGICYYSSIYYSLHTHTRRGRNAGRDGCGFRERYCAQWWSHCARHFD